jgi:hypothetical protein
VKPDTAEADRRREKAPIKFILVLFNVIVVVLCCVLNSHVWFSVSDELRNSFWSLEEQEDEASNLCVKLKLPRKNESFVIFPPFFHVQCFLSEKNASLKLACVLIQ